MPPDEQLPKVERCFSHVSLFSANIYTEGQGSWAYWITVSRNRSYKGSQVNLEGYGSF